MADSSSRLGLCKTVRPGSHKAGSVEDLGWREMLKIYLNYFFSRSFICIQWMLGYRSDPPVSSADMRAFTCQVKRANKFPLLQDYCVNKSGCPFFFLPSREPFPCSFSGWRYQKRCQRNTRWEARTCATYTGKQFQPSLSQNTQSPHWHPPHTVRPQNTMEDREIQSYGCRMEAANHVLILLSRWQAAPSGGGTRPESVAVLCLVCPWPPLSRVAPLCTKS